MSNNVNWIEQSAGVVSGRVAKKRVELLEKLGGLSETVEEEYAVTIPEKKVLGFTVEQASISTQKRKKQNEERAKMKKELQFFEEQESGSASFALSLEAMGVKPIAILPKKTWELITFKTGLFRFENFVNNQISADINGMLDGVYTRASLAVLAVFALVIPLVSGLLLFPNLLAVIAMVTPAILVVVISLIFQVTDKAVSVVMDIVIALMVILSALWFVSLLVAPLYLESIGAPTRLLVIGGICQAIFIVLSFVFVKEGLANVVTKPSIWLMSNRRLVKLLWPNRCDNGKGNYLHPHFPEPDKKFLDILKTMAPYQERLCLAAEASAVHIDKQEIYGRIAEFAEMKKFKPYHDPIVYMKSQDEKFVAVLAQFGRFRRERKAIRLVKNANMSELL